MNAATNGVKYIEKMTDELCKNHRLNDENEDGGVITETAGESCPVRAFQLYISKLNIYALFQRRKNLIPIKGPWWGAKAEGVNTIAKFMRDISAAAELLRIYTNHSVRATPITVLDRKGSAATDLTPVYRAGKILTRNGKCVKCYRR